MERKGQSMSHSGWMWDGVAGKARCPGGLAETMGLLHTFSWDAGSPLARFMASFEDVMLHDRYLPVGMLQSQLAMATACMHHPLSDVHLVNTAPLSQDSTATMQRIGSQCTHLIWKLRRPANQHTHCCCSLASTSCAVGLAALSTLLQALNEFSTSVGGDLLRHGMHVSSGGNSSGQSLRPSACMRTRKLTCS